MCDDCFKNLYYKFDSQEEFQDFETIVQNKWINKKIEIITREKTDHSDIFYKCNSCGEIWALSIPENAWRGFFLPQQKGIEHIKKLNQKDSQRQFGCLVVVIVIVLVVIFRLLI